VLVGRIVAEAATRLENALCRRDPRLREDAPGVCI
jgi:hypothetical protein